MRMGAVQLVAYLRDVEGTIDDFARCAVLAREARYGGVEIMGSEGYLLNQFLAPRTNKRTAGQAARQDVELGAPRLAESQGRAAVVGRELRK
jgi:2,4-dienoyl-CoA reductase (NADPH2)